MGLVRFGSMAALVGWCGLWSMAALAAEAPPAPAMKSPSSALQRADLSLDVGYRRDNFDWSIAGDSSGGNPDVLSELRWDGLDIYQIETEGRVLYNNFYLRGSAAYGVVTDGTVEDSDYDGNGRTGEWSRSKSNADEGDTLDLSLGGGYVLFKHTTENKLTGYLIPVVGYAYNTQDLVLKNGQQTLSGTSTRSGTVAPPLGPIANLDSTYQTEWSGPWVGLDYIGQLTREWDLNLSAEYHWFNYNGEGNWNLRNDFQHPKSFEHDSSGEGVTLDMGAEYKLNNRFAITGGVEYRNWTADGGTNRQFLSNGTTAGSRMNDVNWDSFALTLGTRFGF